MECKSSFKNAANDHKYMYAAQLCSELIQVKMLQLSFLFHCKTFP